jgi:hypothetical protein
MAESANVQTHTIDSVTSEQRRILESRSIRASLMNERCCGIGVVLMKLHTIAINSRRFVHELAAM